ncbi:hypothetical protein H8959_011800, partial [Pygathrix nigripes]
MLQSCGTSRSPVGPESPVFKTPHWAVSFPHYAGERQSADFLFLTPLLKGSRLKVRFCTNESQKSRAELVGQLRRLGFDISEGEVTAPAPGRLPDPEGARPATIPAHPRRKGLLDLGIELEEASRRGRWASAWRVALARVRSEFDQIDTSNPNCVVIADAGESFSYQNMNNAFQVLMELENPVLISLGKGRYYKETSGLMLDVGPYMKALEYACGIKAEVVGKPSPEFFKSALQAIGVEAHQAVMIGDDIVGDVGGAQRCGMRALQVRTGKFRAAQQMLQGACSGPGAHTCSSPKTLPEARSPGAAREITQ